MYYLVHRLRTGDDCDPRVGRPGPDVAVVSAATALVGWSSKAEAIRSASRETQIDQQRLDFKRLYEVSATLSRGESLAEIMPHLVAPSASTWTPRLAWFSSTTRSATVSR